MIQVLICIKGFIYLYKSFPKVDTISKIGASNVTIERSRIKLRQYKNLVYIAVDAIAHWNVYKTVASSNWDLQSYQINT